MDSSDQPRDESKVSKAINALPEKFNQFGFGIDSFLFIVKPGPDKIDKQCLFGISLKVGVRIFSLIMLFEALSSFMDVLSPGTLWKLIVYIAVFVLYLIIGFYAFYSTINEKASFAKISYFLISVIFIIEAVVYLCKSLIKLIEFLTPWDSDFLKLKFLIFVFGYGLYLFIYLYFIWILYCYIISLSDGSAKKDDDGDDKERERLV